MSQNIESSQQLDNLKNQLLQIQRQNQETQQQIDGKLDQLSKSQLIKVQSMNEKLIILHQLESELENINLVENKSLLISRTNDQIKENNKLMAEKLQITLKAKTSVEKEVRELQNRVNKLKESLNKSLDSKSDHQLYKLLDRIEQTIMKNEQELNTIRNKTEAVKKTINQLKSHQMPKQMSFLLPMLYGSAIAILVFVAWAVLQ
ncbi:Hypothetical_protein [Hexamita inflata]|uniref:Hypothetical_protein n=1 Tax=Hexamita inflata TaxID=28002 RepID=A0AA86PCL5_9EUKA|nr:Hypothetical protein HINF_LOCUS23975 [Hexamita inflata]